MDRVHVHRVVHRVVEHRFANDLDATHHHPMVVLAGLRVLVKHLPIVVAREFASTRRDWD